MESLIEQFKFFLLSEGRSRHTIRNNAGNLKRIVKSLGTDFDEQSFRVFIVQNKEKGLSNDGINKLVQAVKNYGKMKKISWTKNIKHFKPDQKIQEKYTDTEIAKLITYEDKNEKYLQDRSELWNNFLAIEAYTGLRPSELCSIKKEHIDHVSCTIKVHDTKTRKWKLVTFAKNSLLKKSIEYLANCRSNKSEYLFSLRDNKPVHSGSIRTVLKKRCDALGIKYKPTYAFRHSYITRLIKNGADIVEVKNLIGHRSITTTERYYHHDLDKLESTSVKDPLLEEHIPIDDKVSQAITRLKSELEKDSRIDKVKLQLAYANIWESIKIS